MAYTPIVNVAITISDVQLTADGFGTPIFICSHRKAEERVLAFTSAADVGEQFGTNSAAYRAALKVFGQTPSVSVFKIGRRDAELRLLPVSVDVGDTFGFTITNKEGVATNISYVALLGDDAADVATGLRADMLSKIASTVDCTPTVSGSVLTLATALNGSEWQDSYFEVSNYVGDFSGADVWRGTETAANCYSRIAAVDSDFYFVACDDNISSFVTAMAGVIETVDKIYFVADSNEANIGTISDPDTTLFGTLAGLNYNNTVTLFHQDAGSSAVAGSHEGANYPELAWIGANAVYDAGSVSWCNLVLAGVTESRAASTGRRLTTTQKSNLEVRNSNYIETDAGVSFTRYGQTVGNEWIDTVHGVHWQKSDLAVSLKSLLLGQRGGKISYDVNGITRVQEVISSSLQRGVNRNFISTYNIVMPRLSEISSTDKLARMLTGVRFSAKLAGAIHEVVIQGTVSES